MYRDEKIVKNYNLEIVLSLCFISSLIIILIHNFTFNTYIRDFILPLSIMLINYLIIIKKLEMKTNNKAFVLLIPIILILLSRIIIKIADINLVLNVFILPLLFSIFFLMLTNDNYTISRNIISWFLELFPKRIFNNTDYIKIPSKIKEKKQTINIIKGILISIPIVIILLTLLGSADKYFSIFIDKIFGIFSRIFNINYLFKNILFWGIWFLILFSVFMNILINKDKKKEKKKLYEINHTTSTTILSLINFVFVLFLISQISKITNNFLQIPIEYTYASYAREGFFQLLGVTTINFIIILFYLYFTNAIKNNKIIKYLLLILISFSVILIFNSYYRMFLYIAQFGFTILRSQVILFLLMELILFIVLIKKISVGLKHKDSIIFAIVILTTYILNLYLCNNTIINIINNHFRF